jgi:hypothetical protein
LWSSALYIGHGKKNACCKWIIAENDAANTRGTNTAFSFSKRHQGLRDKQQSEGDPPRAEDLRVVELPWLVTDEIRHDKHDEGRKVQRELATLNDHLPQDDRITASIPNPRHHMITVFVPLLSAIQIGFKCKNAPVA